MPHGYRRAKCPGGGFKARREPQQQPDYLRLKELAQQQQRAKAKPEPAKGT